MIDMKTFYKIGFILMTISVIGSLWNASVIWNGLTTGSKISTLAGGVFFNLLLATLFFGLWRITPKTPTQVINSPDIDALLKSMEKKDEKN